MISITKDYSIVPDRLNYSNEPLATNYADLVLNKNSHNFSSYIYRNGSIEKLKEIYNDKCAYCETVTSAGAELRVDHYRPKDKIKDDPTHLTGYYWLSYEWSNLILACEKCNGAKSNLFPLAVDGQRCMGPTLVANSTDLDKSAFLPTHISLNNELPLIINPELDKNLTDWFIFLPNAEIKEINNNLRMKETIRICDLNREKLVLDRKKILDEIINKVEKYINDFISDNDSPRLENRINDLLDDLFVMTDVKSKYSRFCYFFYLKFTFFVEGRLGSKSNSLIIKLYSKHKANKLGR